MTPRRSGSGRLVHAGEVGIEIVDADDEEHLRELAAAIGETLDALRSSAAA